MENKRNDKIDEILSSLDGAGRIPAPDFFYTRLKAKMERVSEPARQQSWILKPAYIIAGLLLVLALNTMAVLRNSNDSNTDLASNNDIESVQQSIASEYRLNETNAIYTDLNQDR